MDLLKKPFWLFITTVLPQLLLLYLFSVAYGVIETLLDAEQKEQWEFFGVYLLTLSILYSAYGAIQWVRKQPLSIAFGFISLLIHILNITLFFYFSNSFLPFDIPQWMYTSEDLEIYPYAFLMLGAIHALIILVVQFTDEEKIGKYGLNLLWAFCIPLSIVALVLVFNLFDLDYFDHLGKYVFLYFFIASTCVFLFFIFRFAFIFTFYRKSKNDSISVIKILICLIFPIVGLLVNGGFGNSISGGMFGTFDHPLYFIIAIVNGIVLLIPNPENKMLHLLLFLVRSVFMVYVLYFFMVFLPWLPLSLLAIIFFGLGFLMMSPILIFAYQLSAINTDYKDLQQHFSKRLLATLFVISFLTIPIGITTDYMKDRAELDKCLNHLYARSYFDEVDNDFDKDRVEHLLEKVGQIKEGVMKNTPFLDSYYNWLVLDNLILSDAKLKDLQNIITGTHYISQQRWWNGSWRYPSVNAKIKSSQIESKYDDKSKLWRSTLHLKLGTENQNQVMFKGYLRIPEGAFISNFYLDMPEGKRKFGILAEKKTANWIFNNIVKTRRDPAILQEISPNNFSLSVFPVSENLVRSTGIEIIHKEAIKIQLDSLEFNLGKAIAPENAVIDKGDVLYVTKEAKKTLKEVQRKMQVNILVDWSNGIDPKTILQLAKKVNEHFKKRGNEIRIFAVNHSEHLLGKNWENEIYTIDSVGGFFPEYTMKKILAQTHVSHSDCAQLMVLVTENSATEIFLEGMDDFVFASPDVHHYFTYSQGDALQKTSFLTGEKSASSFQEMKVSKVFQLNWGTKNWYVPNDGQSSVICKHIALTALTSKNQWEEGLAMFQRQQYRTLYPETDIWLQTVKNSFNSHLLSKYTAFLVVETEAQEKMLYHKQKEVLNSGEHLDLEEKIENMSEPSILWYVIVGGVLILLVWWWKTRILVKDLNI